MLGGEVTTSFATMPTAVPLVKAGKLRALAVTTARRAAALPEVPTMQEAGVPGYELVLYNGLLAPARLPVPVTAKLREQIFKALESPEVKSFYASVSADVVTSASTGEFAAQLGASIERLGAAVRAAGAQAN
jgi:tripartite-type tricarboxylate transporter receptor subunit TctC